MILRPSMIRFGIPLTEEGEGWMAGVEMRGRGNISEGLPSPYNTSPAPTGYRVAGAYPAEAEQKPYAGMGSTPCVEPTKGVGPLGLAPAGSGSAFGGFMDRARRYFLRSGDPGSGRSAMTM
jgi:hypothetical protein